MEVVPVDERHIDAGSTELQDGLKSPEAAADDDYAVHAWLLRPTRRRGRAWG
jgi:hypothetical protein